MAPGDLRAGLQLHSLKQSLSGVRCRFKEVEKLPFFGERGSNVTLRGALDKGNCYLSAQGEAHYYKIATLTNYISSIL